MSVLHKSMATGSILLTLTAATLTSASPAMAHEHYGWGGAAAGFVGGVLLSQALRPYPYTYGYPDGYGYPYAYGYRYGYPYRAYRPYRTYPVYRTHYVQPYRTCHLEWRRNGWGEAYRVRVCPY